MLSPDQRLWEIMLEKKKKLGKIEIQEGFDLL